MAYDRYLIAPFDENSGLTTNMRPWQIPDNAWAVLNNMYVFRGRLRKRFGSRYMGSATDFTVTQSILSRLRINLGNTDGSGNISGTVPGSVFEVGQMFTIGDEIFTVVRSGVDQDMLDTGSSSSAVYSTTDGIYAILGSTPATPLFFYPAQPVMGLAQYEFSAINNFPTFGFDTQFAYQFVGGAWQLSVGSPVWHGSDINFFWAYNWVGANYNATAYIRAMFVTNFQVTNINGAGTITDDPIYYYDNTGWNIYIPYLNPAGGAPGTGPFVQTAEIIVPFHDRLLLFNTIENDGTGNGVTTFGTNINYVNRVRWTSQGSPFEVNAWYGVGAKDNAGNKGVNATFANASTLEAIISVEFVKDRLIVGFEESTWELVFTGNEQLPFEWQRLNSELGAMSTQSAIGFDKAVLNIGETGVNQCNGSNVVRIDQKIPEQIFTISNPASEAERICGIRDYYSEMVYWSVPVSSQSSSQPYPTKVLVYNYENKTWAFNDDCITAFGYFDGEPSLTWSTLGGTWSEWSATWDSGESAAQVRQCIAGNQQGYTFIIDTDSTQNTRNAGVLQITNMSAATGGINMTIYNHMLQTGDYIYVETAEGVVLNGWRIYSVIYVDQNTITATYAPEIVKINGLLPTFTGTYTGGATAARVSNYDLQSKMWNPYDKDGKNVYVAKIDFGVQRTATGNFIPGQGGQVTVNYAPSSVNFQDISEGIATNAIMGNSVLETTPYPANLYPLEQIQQRLWHPVYFQTDGECIQIQIVMSPAQISNPDTALADFQIEGMVLFTKPCSDRLQ